MTVGFMLSGFGGMWPRVALLERCLRRLEFEKKKEAEDKVAAEQIEAERAAMQAVDWCAT